jgi:hypothetical protein
MKQMSILCIAIYACIIQDNNYRCEHRNLSYNNAVAAFTIRTSTLDLPSILDRTNKNSFTTYVNRPLSSRRTNPIDIIPCFLSTTSTTIAITNNTDVLENSTDPASTHNSDDDDDDDDQRPVHHLTQNSVTEIHSKLSESDDIDNNNKKKENHITMPSNDFHQLLSHYLSCIQQDMSSNEIIEKAMTIETLWKQRYNIKDQTENNLGVTTPRESIVVDDDNDIVSSFNIVLKAWCKTCQILLEFHDQTGIMSSMSTIKLQQQQQQQQQQMQQMDKFVIPDMHIDVSNIPIYTAKDAATHATEILQEQLSSSSSTLLKPNRTSFHIVLEAWSKSHDIDAPEQVRQLIQMMEKKYQIHPDTVTYNLYIEAIAHGKVGNTANFNDRIDRINDVLTEMERCPTATSNAQTVNSVLHAYSTTIGKYVTQLNYNNVDSSKKSIYEDEIAKLLKSVLQIFNDLKQKYEQTKNTYNQPDMSTYTAVMECFARHGTIQSTEQVEALLSEMKEIQRISNNKRSVKPSVYTYTTVIKAWSRTYHPNAPHRAEELLKECIAMNQSGDNQRQNGYYNNHHNKLTSVVFTSVIQCWSRSQDPTKAVHVLQLLQQMRSMAKDMPLVNPTLLTYNTAMDACTKTRGTPAQQTAALKIAFAIFKTMEITNNIVPNHVTYGTLLKAISALVPLGDETRNTLSKAVFDKATKAAQVDRNVIQQLQKSCDTAVLQSLLLSDPNNSMRQTSNNGNIDYEKIPIQWSKNVRTP